MTEIDIETGTVTAGPELDAKQLAAMYLANRLAEGAAALEAFSQFIAAELPGVVGVFAPRLRAALDTLSDANGDVCEWLGNHYPDGPKPDGMQEVGVNHGD